MSDRTGYSLRQMALEERPRERLLHHGPEALSTSELIAIILGSGMKGKSVLQLAQELISHFGSLTRLAEASIEELCQIRGLGPAKALQLKAAISLGLKVARQPILPKYRIETPLHAYNLVKDDLESQKRELFIVILQDTKGHVIRYETVAVGTLTNALIHPREVFYPAIHHRAASMIIVHNHPSGDPTPSPQDFHLTKTLLAASQVVGIPIHDHLIIGQNSYVSLRQLGRMTGEQGKEVY